MRKNVARFVWVALVVGLSVADDAHGQSKTVTLSRQVENERALDVNPFEIQ